MTELKILFYEVSDGDTWLTQSKGPRLSETHQFEGQKVSKTLFGHYLFNLYYALLWSITFLSFFFEYYYMSFFTQILALLLVVANQESV